MFTKLADSSSHKEHVLDKSLDYKQNVSNYKNLWLNYSIVIHVKYSAENEWINVNWVVFD